VTFSNSMVFNLLFVKKAIKSYKITIDLNKYFQSCSKLQKVSKVNFIARGSLK